MGGQDGYSRNVLAQNTESNTALAGIVVKASKSLDLGFDLSWTESTQALDPFLITDGNGLIAGVSTGHNQGTTHPAE